MTHPWRPRHAGCVVRTSDAENAKCLDTKRLDQNSSRRPWHQFVTKTCENKFTKTFFFLLSKKKGGRFCWHSLLQSESRRGEKLEESKPDLDRFRTYFRMQVEAVRRVWLVSSLSKNTWRWETQIRSVSAVVAGVLVVFDGFRCPFRTTIVIAGCGKIDHAWYWHSAWKYLTVRGGKNCPN